MLFQAHWHGYVCDMTDARVEHVENVPLMWAINTLPLYNCTEGSPSHCRQSPVVRFPCGRVKSIEMYPYTRSTWSQTLTFVQHTVYDVQTSKRLFYTYNTVVLFNIIIIIAVGVSAHAVAGSLAWVHMRHATCTR